MRLSICAILGLLAATTAATAQTQPDQRAQNQQEQQGNYFENGRINIDKNLAERIEKELQQMETEGKDLQLTGPFSLREYCVRCKSGPTMTCRVRVGVEGGRALCGIRGIMFCAEGVGQVDFGKC